MKAIYSILLAFFVLFAPTGLAFALQAPSNHKATEMPRPVLEKKKKKELRKEFRQKLKEAKKAKHGGDTELILLVVLAIFIPPLAVFLYDGLSTRFWIDLILILIWPISIIYALYVILAG